MSTMTTGFGSLLWFLAIIALIPLALWLLKRTPLAGGASGAPGTPRAVAVLPLSAQNKVVTVEIGQGEDRVWLVLGVSAQGIRTLHTMAPQPDSGASAAHAPPSAAFAQLLSRLRGAGPGGDAR
jgi:flagellar protein FliO/FliZ